MSAGSQVSFGDFAVSVGAQAGTLKTADQARREFREAGISVSEWARAQGFDRMTVVDVLRGHRLGNYGEAHRVAIALGLKDGRVVDVKNFKPAKAAA